MFVVLLVTAKHTGEGGHITSVSLIKVLVSLEVTSLIIPGCIGVCHACLRVLAPQIDRHNINTFTSLAFYFYTALLEHYLFLLFTDNQTFSMIRRLMS